MITQKGTSEMDKTSPSDQVNSQQSLFCAADYHGNKVVAERILGCLLFVFAFPVILLIVAIVRLTSSGNGIYKQIRVGKGGEEFSIYKIRTMYQDAEACGNPQWSTPGDSRITPVGRILRFLHLDELPQLINVARGEMSLVGPRPERPAFVEKLAETVPNYLDRLEVLPGVTGLAQINLPPDESLDCVGKKVILDREYIQNASLFLDLRIFFCTFFRMTGLRHGVAPKLFGVERDPDALPLLTGACTDTVELVSSLDDTSIFFPALIASPALDSTPVCVESQQQGQVVYSASTDTIPPQSGGETVATDLSPRRPR